MSENKIIVLKKGQKVSVCNMPFTESELKHVIEEAYTNKCELDRIRALASGDIKAANAANTIFESEAETNSIGSGSA